MMQGKLGEQCNRHMARLITNTYKTTGHWYKSHYKVFGKRRGQAEIDSGRLVGRQQYKCIDCPLCSQEVEDLPHMFGCCNSEGLVDIRKHADNRVINKIMEVMHGSHGLGELCSASGLSGEEVIEKVVVGHFCVLGGSSKLRKSAEAVMLAVPWLKYAGILNVALRKMLMAIMMEGIDEQVCRFSSGAKMGIGKDRSCECSKCKCMVVVEPLVESIISTYVQCGMDIWEERCRLWGEYVETWEFVVPRAGGVSGEEAGGTWGGEGEEVWESNWVVEDEEQLEEQRMEREEGEVGDVDRDVSWHCSVNLKYEQRKEEYDEINRKVRVWCGYPVKESGREKINARRREVGLSADIRELMDVEGG
jgi:hypothetical protein